MIVRKEELLLRDSGSWTAFEFHSCERTFRASKLQMCKNVRICFFLGWRQQQQQPGCEAGNSLAGADQESRTEKGSEGGRMGAGLGLGDHTGSGCSIRREHTRFRVQSSLGRGDWPSFDLGPELGSPPPARKITWGLETDPNWKTRSVIHCDCNGHSALRWHKIHSPPFRLESNASFASNLAQSRSGGLRVLRWLLQWR